jgi:CelD/BcsL family acetyltransferase involved in cellulose biosynthesis
MQLFWWEAMRHWRARGVLSYDMGGDGSYKEKYGSVDTPSVSFHRSRFGVMGVGREAARRLFFARIALAGRFTRSRGSNAPVDTDPGRG